MEGHKAITFHVTYAETGRKAKLIGITSFAEFMEEVQVMLRCS
jgi:hypothetical protein